jgi:hypothetical protein
MSYTDRLNNLSALLSEASDPDSLDEASYWDKLTPFQRKPLKKLQTMNNNIESQVKDLFSAVRRLRDEVEALSRFDPVIKRNELKILNNFLAELEPHRNFWYGTTVANTVAKVLSKGQALKP